MCSFLVFFMHITVRLNDIFSKRLEPYLARGLTKTQIITSALDAYLDKLDDHSITPIEEQLPLSDTTISNKPNLSNLINNSKVSSRKNKKKSKR